MDVHEKLQMFNHLIEVGFAASPRHTYCHVACVLDGGPQTQSTVEGSKGMHDEIEHVETPEQDSIFTTVAMQDSQ